MRPSQLLRPRYVADRVRLAVHQRLHPDAPWLTAEATEALDRWLRPEHVGIEWGSGRSTVWFAQRVGRLVSVEHDAGWHATVAAQLVANGITNVDYRLAPCEPERIETPEWIAAMFASDYVRAVDHPNFRLLLDTYHFWIENDSVHDVTDALPLIGHVHVAEKVGRVPPGEGGGSDYRPLFRILKEGGYDSTISVEADFADDLIRRRGQTILEYLKQEWQES